MSARQIPAEALEHLEGELLRLQAVIGGAAELWEACQGDVKPSKASNALGVVLDNAHDHAAAMASLVGEIERGGRRAN